MAIATAKRFRKRARGPEARAQRRDEILDAAEELLGDRRFADLHMAQLAEELGFAKGTLYLYFRSKESVFLALVQRSLEAWFLAIGERMARAAFIEPHALACELTDAFIEQPRLFNLLALLHTVLEQNITDEEAVEFKSVVARRTRRAGIELERLIPALEPGEGARLLVHVLALVVGLSQASDPSPAMERALERPELRHLQVDFRTELSLSLSALFHGFGAALQAHGRTA